MEDEEVMLGGGGEDPWAEEDKVRLGQDERVRLLVGEYEAEATGWRMRWLGCLVEVEEVRLGGG